MTTTQQPSFLVTSCPEHGVTVTGDAKSALNYQEVAHECQQDHMFGHGHTHEFGVSCWHCCEQMTVAPGIVLA